MNLFGMLGNTRKDNIMKDSEMIREEAVRFYNDKREHRKVDENEIAGRIFDSLYLIMLRLESIEDRLEEMKNERNCS